MHIPSRRNFLKRVSTGAAMAMAWGAFSPFRSNLALAAPTIPNHLVVLLRLQGGADFYEYIQPESNSLAQRRKTLYRDVNDPAALSLGNYTGQKFIIHPNFTDITDPKTSAVTPGIHSLFQQGKVAVFHGTSATVSRSHEIATREMAKGVLNDATASGWGARMIRYILEHGATPENEIFMGVNFDDAQVITARNFSPTSVGSLGNFNYSSIANVGTFDRDWINQIAERSLELVPSTAASAERMVASAQTNFHRSIAMIQEANKVAVNAFPADAGGLGSRLRDVLRMRRYSLANPGKLPVRFVTVGQGGHDTHGEQRAGEVKNAKAINAAVGAFFNELAADGDTAVTMIIHGEFGRTNVENDTQGTDHGQCGPFFVIGSRIRGGHYGVPQSEQNILSHAWYRTEVDARNVFAQICEASGVPGNAIFTQPYKTHDVGQLFV